MNTETEVRGQRKTLVGTVTGTKMDKTIVVSVIRKVRHPKYQKYVTSRKRYLVHDELEACQVGDEVEIIETRPLSRLKRWRLQEIKSRSETARS